MVCVKNQAESSSCSYSWSTLHTPITPTLPYNPNATSCPNLRLAATPAPTPFHSQLGCVSLPNCNAVCRARKWMWHCLCFHSTRCIDIDTRKAKSLRGTHHDETNSSVEEASFLMRKAVAHQAAGSQAGGRKTRESKEMSQMRWVILCQV